MPDPRAHTGYPRPPITEAVIEIRFEQPSNEDELKKFSSRLAADYPNESVNRQQGFHIDLLGGIMELREEGTVVRRANEDEDEIVLLGPSNLIVSQLAVYPGWPHFRARFEAVWRAWKKLVGYRKVRRIGMRYINRIDLPTEGTRVEHENYLNVYIQLPKTIETLSAYSFQAQSAMPDIGSVVTINSASVPSPLPNAVAFVIDIDIGREVDVPQKDDDIFEFLEQLRIKKNEVFEASIKDAARERFMNDHALR